MRRVFFTVMASVAVFAFVPASAMARKHHRHHRHHHRHHVRAHARTHKFGSFTAPGTTTPTTPGSTGTAGTVTSFDPTTGQLVITLADGTTTETGMVTSDTEIECQSMGDGSSSMGEDGDGGQSRGDGPRDQNGGGDDNGNDGGDDQGEGQSCSTANLTSGAVVLGAELRIDSSGAVWEKIELQS
jgi:hypothetical protein